MSLSNKCYPLFMIMILVTFSQMVSAKPLDQVTFQCIQSFEYFAYGIQENFTEADQLNIVWLPQYELPEIDGVSGRAINHFATRILLSRMIDGDQEIWLELGNLYDLYIEPVFGKYRVNENSLTLVPRRLGLDDFFAISMADDLIVDNSGNIWSSVDQFIAERVAILPGSDNPFAATYASVAIYNESSNEFNPISEAPQIPFRSDTRFRDSLTEIMLDSNGVLWVFMVRDEVYRFDPMTDTFPLVMELSETVFQSATPTLNGSVLVDIVPASGNPSPIPLTLSAGDTFFELFPGIGEIQSIPAPPISLLTGIPVIVDKYNRAWFSAMAYLADGQWTVVNPNPTQTQAMLDRIQFPIVWTFPTPILADSSGRMWFETLGDNSFGTTGKAWFDPETGHGCKFSNSAGNIIEDDNGYLWLFDPATRTIYRSADSVIDPDLNDLQLTSLCSPDPDTVRVWRVRNINPDPVDFTWDVVGTDQTGSGTVPGGTEESPGEVTFETVAVDGSPNTVRIFVGGQLQDQLTNRG